MTIAGKADFRESYFNPKTKIGCYQMNSHYPQFSFQISVALAKICFLYVYIHELYKNIFELVPPSSRNANFSDPTPHKMHRMLRSSKERQRPYLWIIYWHVLHFFQLTGRRSSTRILVRVYCDANYYGADCNTYCVGRDDSRGHYRCDDNTGNKICLAGWRGQNCLTGE